MKFLKRLNYLLRRNINALRRLFKLILFSSVLYAFFYALIIRAGFGYFSIRNIEILGAFRFMNEADLKTVIESSLIGKNLLTLDVSKYEKQLEGTFLVLEEIKIEKNFPNEVKISFFEREPRAILLEEFSEVNYVLDQGGFVLGISESGFLNLPRIVVQGELEIGVGRFVPGDDIKRLLSLLSLIKEADLRVNNIAIRDSFYQMNLGETQIIFPKSNLFEQKVGLLKKTLQKYNLSNLQLKKIDLRYDNVVIEY